MLELRLYRGLGHRGPHECDEFRELSKRVSHLLLLVGTQLTRPFEDLEELL